MVELALATAQPPPPMSDLTLTATRSARSLVAVVARFSRWRGVLMLVLAGVAGFVAALVVTLVGWATSELHTLLFALPVDSRLSQQTALVSPILAVVPAVGGVLVGLSIYLARRFRTRPPVDPIEANAVYGGKMSFRESVIVTLQTVLSSSFGASVGLEAGYTQMSSSIASHIGSRLSLRRNEIRTLVGCGAAGAIAAAFNAPFTGAFYGFELIIGLYSVGLLAPVVTASLVASFTARWLGAVQTPIVLESVNPLSGADVFPFLILGVISGGVAIGTMLAVAQIERGFTLSRLPQYVRPVVGGIAIMVLAKRSAVSKPAVSKPDVSKPDLPKIA